MKFPESAWLVALQPVQQPVTEPVIETEERPDDTDLTQDFLAYETRRVYDMRSIVTCCGTKPFFKSRRQLLVEYIRVNKQRNKGKGLSPFKRDKKLCKKKAFVVKNQIF